MGARLSFSNRGRGRQGLPASQRLGGDSELDAKKSVKLNRGRDQTSNVFSRLSGNPTAAPADGIRPVSGQEAAEVDPDGARKHLVYSYLLNDVYLS